MYWFMAPIFQQLHMNATKEWKMGATGDVMEEDEGFLVISIKTAYINIYECKKWIENMYWFMAPIFQRYYMNATEEWRMGALGK